MSVCIQPWTGLDVICKDLPDRTKKLLKSFNFVTISKMEHSYLVMSTAFGSSTTTIEFPVIGHNLFPAYPVTMMIPPPPVYVVSSTNSRTSPAPSQSPSPQSSYCHCILFGENFHIAKKIGAGGFGHIYHAINVSTNQSVALKLESMYSPHSTLDMENEILKALQDIEGIPRWINYGQDGVDRILMLELLGLSLQQLLNDCGGRFSVKTVHMLALQLITRLEAIHYKNVVHRDIKPANIVMGIGKEATSVYVVDFGLAKFFRHAESLEHIPHRRDKNLVGTSRFASINCHMGVETGRRDDVESLAYTLIYMLKGRLPWQGLKPQPENRKAKSERVQYIKANTPVAVLCEELPMVFSKILLYSRNLTFEACPDYSYLKQLVNRSMQDLGIVYDYQFDWLLKFPNTQSG